MTTADRSDRWTADHASTLVLASTGTTGSRVAAGLRAAGQPVRTVSRRPGAADLVFDWFEPATYDAVLDGVRGIYLVLPDGVAEPMPVVAPFLEKARSAGVGRITLLSSSAVPVGSPGPGVVAARLPEYAAGWAVLRPSWFMSNFTGNHAHAESARLTGEIVSATGDGRIAFIDPSDIAAVAVHTLTTPQPVNEALTLTGPEPLSFDEVARALSRHTGRTIRHRRVETSELADRWAAAGVPRAFAELLAGLDEGIAKGSENRVTTTVADRLGRPARSFAEFLGS